MVQEVEEIMGDTLRKEVVVVIMGRGMEDSVLVALQMMSLWNLRQVWPLLHQLECDDVLGFGRQFESFPIMRIWTIIGEEQSITALIWCVGLMRSSSIKLRTQEGRILQRLLGCLKSFRER